MALTFRHHQLPNGLDIVTEQNPDSHSVAAGLFVKTGSRDEDVSVNGVSHFLEHMMFKGSTQYTWEDVNRIFDEIGARLQRVHQPGDDGLLRQRDPRIYRAGRSSTCRHLLRPAIRVDDFDDRKKGDPGRDCDVPRRPGAPACTSG